MALFQAHLGTTFDHHDNFGGSASIVSPTGERSVGVPVDDIIAFTTRAIVDGGHTIPQEIRDRISQTSSSARDALAPQKRFQSLSVDVPGKCPNACEYCVSAMHRENLGEVTKGRRIKEDFVGKYGDALLYVRSEGTDTLIFTGSDSDPMANVAFMEHLCELNRELGTQRFTKIEIQTSGILMTDENLGKLKGMGIKTIALSLSSLSDEENSRISNIRPNIQFQILELCERIKKTGFNLRLCFNLTDAYHPYMELGMEGFFKVCKDHGANQLTFREMYKCGKGPIDAWIDAHQFDPEYMTTIRSYIREHGRPLSVLPFGQTLYSIQGMSVVVDDDCMNSKEMTTTSKYSIVRPNGHLYSRWDDEGSLIM